MNARPLMLAHFWKPRIPYILFGFLLLSLFIHLITFYLFRIEYPPTVTITPPPTRVVMLQPDNPENRAFLRWIKASDPATLAKPPMANPPLENIFEFEPSYATRTAEPVTSGLFDTHHHLETFPPAIDGFTLAARMEKPKQPATPTAFRIPPTKIVYDSAIERRFDGEIPQPEFKRTKAASLIPATFLIGTPSIGEKPLVYLQTSSGDETLDREAESFLSQLRFSHGKLEWGFVTFYWGPEIFARPHLPANDS